jgi:hypothetical protein
MSKEGERDYVLFAREMKRVGLGDLWAETLRTGNLKPLMDEVVPRAVRGCLPDGHKILLVLVVDFSSAPESVRQPGLAIRVAHPSFKKLRGPIPLTLSSAQRTGCDDQILGDER